MGDDAAAADSTRHTLLYVLEQLLRALHPIIPFVTEEIWHSVAPKLGITADTISTQAWPEVNPAFDAPDAAADIEWLKAAVTQLRSIRSQMNIAPSKAVPLLLQDGEAADRERALGGGQAQGEIKIWHHRLTRRSRRDRWSSGPRPRRRYSPAPVRAGSPATGCR